MRKYVRRLTNPFINKTGRARSFYRSTHGNMLVEALFACVLTGIVSAALMQGYSQISQVSVDTQAQLDATAVSTEIIDQLRSLQFSFVAANLGTHDVPINGASATGDPLFPRPLLRDTGLTYYNGPGVSDANNIMHAKNNVATVTLTQASVNGRGQTSSILATITIVFTDGRGTHTLTNNTLLAASGLNG